MLFKIGDYVTRNSYNNDTVFKIISMENDIYNLKGVDVRLYADSPPDDLQLYNIDNPNENIDDEFVTETNEILNLDRNSFFYLPGKILHIDGDGDYLERCMRFYKKMKVQAYGVVLKEEMVSDEITI